MLKNIKKMQIFDIFIVFYAILNKLSSKKNYKRKKKEIQKNYERFIYPLESCA